MHIFNKDVDKWVLFRCRLAVECVIIMSVLNFNLMIYYLTLPNH